MSRIGSMVNLFPTHDDGGVDKEQDEGCLQQWASIAVIVLYAVSTLVALVLSLITSSDTLFAHMMALGLFPCLNLAALAAFAVLRWQSLLHLPLAVHRPDEHCRHVSVPQLQRPGCFQYYSRMMDSTTGASTLQTTGGRAQQARSQATAFVP